MSLASLNGRYSETSDPRSTCDFLAFLRCERPQLLSFCSVVGRHYSGSCIGLTSFIRSYVFNIMGYRFTGTFESCPFKQVYVSHDRPYVGRPVGRREEFLQLASHKIPGLLHARVDCWRPYRSEPKRLFKVAQTTSRYHSTSDESHPAPLLCAPAMGEQ